MARKELETPIDVREVQGSGYFSKQLLWSGKVGEAGVG